MTEPVLDAARIVAGNNRSVARNSGLIEHRPRSAESLTYAALADRLGTTQEAARSLMRR
jgi:hypothetical protein